MLLLFESSNCILVMPFTCVFDVNKFLRYMICFLSVIEFIGSSPISPYSGIFGVDLGALTIFLMMDNYHWVNFVCHFL